MKGDSPQDFEKMARLYKACGVQKTATCEAAIMARTPLEPPQEPKQDEPKQEATKQQPVQQEVMKAEAAKKGVPREGTKTTR